MKEQKDMLWITAGFNQPLKSFYDNFDDEISV